MDKDRQKKVFDELEKLGEDEVRANIAGHVYGEDKLRLVEEWLRRQAQSRADAQAARDAAVVAEQTEIARSSRDAAWASARWGKWAFAVAALALAVAAWGTFVRP